MWLQCYFFNPLCSSGSAVSILFIISLVGTSALGRIFARGSDHEEYSGLFSDSDVVEIDEGLDGDMSLLQDEHFQEIMMLVQQLPREERRDRNQIFMKTLSIFIMHLALLRPLEETQSNPIKLTKWLWSWEHSWKINVLKFLPSNYHQLVHQHKKREKKEEKSKSWLK